jgi:hypothetical protein
MKNYVIGTHFNGEHFTNLLSNRIIREIEKETKNHVSELQVVNNKNFIVVRGYTTHKNPFNLSQLFISYYEELFGKQMTFNVIDLIEYDTLPGKNPIYFKKNYINDKVNDNLQIISVEDSFIGKNYRYTANTEMEIVLMEGDMEKETLRDYFNNYEFYKIDKPINNFYSNINFGKNLRSSKLYEFYFNYITYNIFERNLCKDLSIEFFTDADFDDISWENVKLEVKSNSLIVSEEWLVSLILDLFSFKPEDIIKKWDLTNYDFENEIIRRTKPIWEVKDKVGEMILF